MRKIPKDNLQTRLVQLRKVYKRLKENYLLTKSITIIIYLKFLKKELDYLERSIYRK
jgi:hypothetical protein